MNTDTNHIIDRLKHLRQDPLLRPSTAFRTNARIRLLNMYAPSPAPVSFFQRSPHPVRVAFRFAIIVFFLSGGTVYAAQNSTPKDMLFPVKTLSEQAALTLSPTENIKTSVAATIIRRRAEENEEAKQTGDREEIEQTVINFESAVVSVRSDRHIDHERIEEEIKKYSGEFPEYEDKNTDTNGAEQTEVQGVQDDRESSEPSDTVSQEYEKRDDAEKISPTPEPTEPASSEQEDQHEDN